MRTNANPKCRHFVSDATGMPSNLTHHAFNLPSLETTSFGISVLPFKYTPKEKERERADYKYRLLCEMSWVIAFVFPTQHTHKHRKKKKLFKIVFVFFCSSFRIVPRRVFSCARQSSRRGGGARRKIVFSALSVRCGVRERACR
ncbi:hypothetical protein CDAR_598241 [Caerostris darwini]|uniref:Uncharacterized protein n=1 Tax=Caerostris darwini TaxID=1538125 RepID=A0AAV4QKA7_9ARAC|nr:hypothetical protein CDAR_598241 [Caerostris darwini]